MISILKGECYIIHISILMITWEFSMPNPSKNDQKDGNKKRKRPTCKNCDLEILVFAKYCPNCGEELRSSQS